MGKIDTIKRLWRRDKYQLLVAAYDHLCHTHITDLLSDEAFLKLTFRIKIREKLDLQHPVTFNQKLQWLKLYDRQERYITMVDKVLVKDYVSGIIGEEYIIPTLGAWERFEDIDFDALPDQFVLKCNHDSGSVVFCRDKTSFDREAARRKLNKCLRTDPFYWGREWPYRNVKRKILAEALVQDEPGKEIPDYKLLCFNGKVRCSFVGNERFSEDGLRTTYFDRDWNELPFERHFPKSGVKIPKPEYYEKMLAIAAKLAEGIPFVRVDFYEVAGKLYFGELTFYPGSGMLEFKPPEWDAILGSWLELPEKTIGGD
jgi:hypothetical protein